MSETFETVTAVLRDEQSPQYSSPLIKQSMGQNEEDSAPVSLMKEDIISTLAERWTEECSHLQESTYLEEHQCQDIFQRIQDNAVHLLNQV